MEIQRNTMLGSLIQLRNQGWRPAVVIDIGAQVGTGDDLCRSRSLVGLYLLKVDVDGRELHVLEDATETLRNSPCAVVDFMRHQGFAVHDIVNPLYRPTDMALWQVDTVFVKHDGEFRRSHTFGDAATMMALAGG